MTDQRLPYTDAETLPQMAFDCHAVEHNMHLGHRGLESYPAQLLAEQPLPASARVHSRYQVSDDLAQMADGLELHFD